MVKFTSAYIFKCLPDLTLLETLLYGILYANSNNNIVYAPLDSLSNFLNSPSKLKFKNLEKKGYIVKNKEKDTYTIIRNKHSEFKTIKSNHYKDTLSILYGLMKESKQEYTAECLASYLGCHPSTISKSLHNIPEAKYKAEWLNNGTSGKVFKWRIDNAPSKEHPARPDYIMFYPELLSDISTLKDKLIQSYLYTVHRMGIEADNKELSHLLGKQTKENYILSICDIIPTTKPIRIPLYTEFKGLDLCILSIVSEYRLRGINAVWSLNAFTSLLGITTKEAYLVCKKLIKKKKLSRPDKKVITSWKNYTGSDDDFKNAVTVTKTQNIILQNLKLKPLAS